MSRSLLEVSKTFQGSTRNISEPRQSGVHLPPRGGEMVELSISVSQIQANALLQQFEAILALGFQG